MGLLDPIPSASPPGWAIASGAVLVALLDKLVSNNALTPSDAANVIREARVGIDKFAGHQAYGDAGHFLAGLARKFPAQ
jgi:hypothetical protein